MDSVDIFYVVCTTIVGFCILFILGYVKGFKDIEEVYAHKACETTYTTFEDVQKCKQEVTTNDVIFTINREKLF